MMVCYTFYQVVYISQFYGVVTFIFIVFYVALYAIHTRFLPYSEQEKTWAIAIKSFLPFFWLLFLSSIIITICISINFYLLNTAYFNLIIVGSHLLVGNMITIILSIIVFGIKSIPADDDPAITPKRRPDP